MYRDDFTFNNKSVVRKETIGEDLFQATARISETLINFRTHVQCEHWKSMKRNRFLFMPHPKRKTVTVSARFIIKHPPSISHAFVIFIGASYFTREIKNNVRRGYSNSESNPRKRKNHFRSFGRADEQSVVRYREPPLKNRCSTASEIF